MSCLTHSACTILDEVESDRVPVAYTLSHANVRDQSTACYSIALLLTGTMATSDFMKSNRIYFYGSGLLFSWRCWRS